MQQTTEIIAHKMSPKVVTKFKVIETITKEKMMSFNQLSKKSEGVEAYNAYVKDNNITDSKHFKLCSKSKKDVIKCKGTTRKRITKKKVPHKKKSDSKTKTKSKKHQGKKNSPKNSRSTQKSRSKTPEFEGINNGSSLGMMNTTSDNNAFFTPESTINSNAFLTPEGDRRVTISPRELSALKKLIASGEQSSPNSPSITMNNADSQGRRKTISPQQLAALKKLLASEQSAKTVKNVKMRSPNPRRKARNVLNPKYYGNEWVK